MNSFKSTCVLGVCLIGMLAGTEAYANAPSADELTYREAFAKGKALYDQGKYGEALPYYEKAVDLAPRIFGESDRNTGEILSELAMLYQILGRAENAMLVSDRLRRLDRHLAERTLANLAEQDQLDFLETIDERHRRVALSIALEAKTTGAATLSAAWVLNGKAVAHQILAERALLARDVRNAKVPPIAADLTAVRRRLTMLALAPCDKKRQTERQQELARLTQRERELSKQLGQAVGRPMRDDPWIELSEVREAIPAGAILIEISRFEVVNFKAKRDEKQSDGPRYAAWLIPNQGDVRLIDLGDADRIDAAVAVVRKGLLAAQGTATQRSIIVEKGEQDAEKILQPALATLAKLVLQPLREHIDNHKHWLISPDGALWLVPWEALPLDDKTYTIEKHTLRYLVSGRDLAAPAFTGQVKRDPPLIMADPDFDIEPKEAAALTAKLLGIQPPANDGPAVALDDPQATPPESLIRRAFRLPATAAEAAAIKPKLQAYAGEEPRVYLGKDALEGVFKSVRSPKVVVLSTTGFFLEDQDVQPCGRPKLDGKRPAPGKDGEYMKNPLLRCGLLLACCNKHGKATGNQEDGVLTGLEILACDLRGTDLVVLSACETGLGQVRNGEGVAGLRQAFQLAGAQTVVASLWDVSDRDTALLMIDFFDGLAIGKSTAEALREARLARIKAHRDRDGAAHPFYWAAFTVTGR